MNRELLISEIRESSGQSPRHRPSAASTFNKVAHHPDIAAYLTHCVCDDGYLAGDLRICGFSRLLEENLESAGPGDLLYPHGFVVIGTSVGGNALCADAGTGNVYWFGHSQFTEHWITWNDPVTGELREADEYSADAIRIAGKKLADSVEQVFHDLFSGELDAFIAQHG